MKVTLSYKITKDNNYQKLVIINLKQFYQINIVLFILIFSNLLYHQNHYNKKTIFSYSFSNKYIISCFINFFLIINI